MAGLKTQQQMIRDQICMNYVHVIYVLCWVAEVTQFVTEESE